MEKTEAGAAHFVDGIIRTNQSSVIASGLELEEQCARLMEDLDEQRKSPTLAKLVEQRSRLNVLQNNISKWMASWMEHLQVQATIEPGSCQLLEDGDILQDINMLHACLDQILYRICLPSRQVGNGTIQAFKTLKDKQTFHTFAQMEFKLRHAQADDALHDLRKLLSIKESLKRYRQQHIAGPGYAAKTRAHSYLQRFSKKIGRSSKQYQRAFEAMTVLDSCDIFPDIKCGDWRLRFKVLKADDLVYFDRQDNVQQLGEGRREASWIWRVSNRINNGGEDGLDDEMHSLVQIEWAKTKARSERWVEEVTLVHEEMRRTLAFLDYKRCWWEMKAIDGQTTASDQLQHGLKAYAHKQAGYHQELMVVFWKKWQPLLECNDMPYIGWTLP